MSGFVFPVAGIEAIIGAMLARGVKLEIASLADFQLSSSRCYPEWMLDEAARHAVAGIIGVQEADFEKICAACYWLNQPPVSWPFDAIQQGLEVGTIMFAQTPNSPAIEAGIDTFLNLPRA